MSRITSHAKDNLLSARAHSFAFRKRGVLGALFLLPGSVMVIFSKPLVPHDSPVDHLMESLGLLFFLAYVFFRVWATIYIGDRKEIRLVTEGPYSVCRNPLYVGSLCAAFAIVFFLKSFVLLAATILGAIFYRYFVIPSEEAVLRSIFGESFDRYSGETPRLVPSLASYHSSSVVQMSLPSMRRELKRLLCSTFLLLGAIPFCHLRALTWWPHLLTLP